MKLIIPSLFILILLGGCGEKDPLIEAFPIIDNPLDQSDELFSISNKALDLSVLRVTLEDGVNIFRTVEEGTLYNGWIKKTHRNDRVGYLFHCQNGKQNGLFTAWHENGMKMVERMWSDGFRNGPFKIWSSAGILESRGFNSNNLNHGLIEEFYSNGEKKSEAQYQNGKLDTFSRWKPNGSLCPLTSVKSGAGLVVHYKEDGTIDSNESYYGGELDYGQPSLPIDSELDIEINNTTELDITLPEVWPPIVDYGQPSLPIDSELNIEINNTTELDITLPEVLPPIDLNASITD